MNRVTMLVFVAFLVVVLSGLIWIAQADVGPDAQRVEKIVSDAQPPR
jgi:hypothetical protein